MTVIEERTMRAVQAIPKAIGGMTDQLRRIADALEKMEAKDGPTIGQIVRDALERGEGRYPDQKVR